MNKKRFEERRNRFMDMMEDGVALIPSGTPCPRNGDQDFPFRAASDFYFLTGLHEPHAWAVLIKDGDRRGFEMYLQPFDPEREMWTGKRTGSAGAVKKIGADRGYDIAEFFDSLPAILENRRHLYYEFGSDEKTDEKILAITDKLKQDARRGVFGPWEIKDPRLITWRMRQIKDRHDIADHKKAADITAEAFKSAMRAVRPGMKEYELAAVVEFEFARRGAERLAFDTICATGANAATLHYTSNVATIKKGEMVLIDAGAENNMVTADISRTFPSDGKFTPACATAYQWVLKAQKAAIKKTVPGVTYAQVHRTALEILCRGLVSMGVLSGPIEKIIEEETYRPYFMHRIGHWLGMDCHDVGPYFENSESIKLEPGMVMTVEPGLYFRNQPKVPQEFRGIGIRIEDDVLVTGNGNKILTKAVPKEIRDIEAFMAESGSWWGDIEPIS